MNGTPEQEIRKLKGLIGQLTRENEDLRAEYKLDRFFRECREKAEAESREALKRAKELSRENEKLQAKLKRIQEALEQSKANADRCSAETTGLRAELKALRSKNKALEKENQSMKDQIETLEAEKKHAEAEAKKLRMQKSKDSRNSSKPSSQTPSHPPIPNGRPETCRNPGGQPGHEHHGRMPEFTGQGGRVRVLGEEDRLWSDPDYEFVEFKIKRVITPVVKVCEDVYLVPLFRNRRTGACREAAHLENLKDEMNYSAEAKAILFMANHYCGASIGSTQDLMRELTQKGLNPSTGFISHLTQEFAEKSEAGRIEAFSKMLGAHVLNVDGTTVRVGGRMYTITICVSGPYTLYFFRPKKGKAGVAGTPVEKTVAILVHDHDIEYYHYGSGHQECLTHVIRYLIAAIQQEPKLTWHLKMLTLLRDMIKRVKEESEKEEVCGETADCVSKQRLPEEEIQFFRELFIQYTNEGLEEYRIHPAKSWFQDGHNLCRRLAKDPDAYLRFLEDNEIPYTNNTCENRARKVKKKSNGQFGFRGILGVVAWCEARSTIDMLLQSDKPLLNGIAEIFRKEPRAEDRLRLQETLLPMLDMILESDESIGKKLEKKRTACETELNEAEKQMNQLQARKKTDSKGNDAWEEKVRSAEYRLHCTADALREVMEQIDFNNSHMKRIRKDIRMAKEKIERYHVQMSRASDKMPAAEELCLSDADMQKLQDAAWKHQQSLDRFHEAAERLTAAKNEYGLLSCTLPGVESVQKDEKGNKEVVYASANPEDVEKVKQNVLQAWEEFLRAKEAMEKTQIPLDALRKGRVKRRYKKRASKADRIKVGAAG
jgi:hypothetical protein